MSNVMDNGAILPSGLLGVSDQDMMAGFNKTYKNSALRIGIVINTYPISDDKNRAKLTTEYDVLVIEQNEDRGTTTILYRNCMSSEGLGSIADFFERTLRKKKKKTTKGDSTNLKGQDGAIVLLLCLDSMSDKGIIISSLTHPDRKTKLLTDEPYLEGEYNGVNIKVATDGSTTLTFRGATGNDGKVLDASQGQTVISIEKDGSFQVQHDKVTFRMGRDGNASLVAKKDIILNASGNINITATGDVNMQCTNLKVNASGKADVTVGGDCNVTSSGKTTVKASEIDLNGAASGITTMNSHQGVIDFITGVPVQPSNTVKSDV
jgi:hypothetical protein